MICKPESMKLLYLPLFAFGLLSCTYKQYVLVAQYDLPVYDHAGVRHQDIPVGDTVTTSAYFNKFLPSEERTTPVKGLSPVLYKDYLLSAYNPIELSRVVKIESVSRSYIKRRRRSFRYVINYPIYIRPANKPSTTTTTSPGGSGSSAGYRTIHTGPRGGRYYINKNGNKTYIKK